MARLLLLLTSLLLIGSATGAELGRLFFAPDERAALDRERQKTSGVFSATDQITLGGYVQRSSGKSTVWVNQTPRHENESAQGVAVTKAPGKSGGIPLQLPSGRQIRLKPGQTLDVTSGRVREGYQEPEGRRPGTENR